FEMLDETRMHFADPADRGAVDEYAASPPGMQRRMPVLFGHDNPRMHQRFQVAFHIEDIDQTFWCTPLFRQRVTVCQATDAQWLIVAFPGAKKTATNFEHAHTFLAARQ